MGAMQRYVSKELTHFVGKNLRKEIMDKNQRREEQYNILLKIIKEKCISYHPHFPDEPPTTRRTRIVYPGNFSNNVMINPSMVCFCDIPIEDLGIHIRKYSHFGLSFQKSFLIKKGATPLLYVERNSAFISTFRSEYFDEMVKLYFESCSSIGSLHDLIKNESNPEEFIKMVESTPKECDKISGFILYLLSYIKFFDSSKSDDDEENFYMEREWRSPCYILFEIADICRIILPSSYSKRFRNDVPGYVGQITFSDERLG
jgi:Putative abortive phage resistance protein AbiGi, antitoxin